MQVFVPEVGNGTALEDRREGDASRTEDDEDDGRVDGDAEGDLELEDSEIEG